MLDSLVRVSRRVGGAADLLATEMRAARENSLAIRARLATRRARSQKRRARAQVPNFTPALGPVPAVRCVKGWRNAAKERADERAPSLLIGNTQAAPTVT